MDPDPWTRSGPKNWFDSGSGTRMNLTYYLIFSLKHFNSKLTHIFQIFWMFFPSSIFTKNRYFSNIYWYFYRLLDQDPHLFSWGSYWCRGYGYVFQHDERGNCPGTMGGLYVCVFHWIKILLNQAIFPLIPFSWPGDYRRGRGPGVTVCFSSLWYR